MPQLAVICTCEVRNNPNFQSSGLYEISPPDVGFLKYEPGLIVTNSVAKMNQDRIIPVMVVKSTNKTFSIKKSNPIAKILRFKVRILCQLIRIQTIRINPKHLSHLIVLTSLMIIENKCLKVSMPMQIYLHRKIQD